jgi:2-amino-4-hydroxy-6-hydroxymethyldihydropteridine diphosphokinase
MALWHIALGGNVGNPCETFARALDQIAQLDDCRVVRTSRLYRTAAVGDNAGSDFVNGAAAIETTLDPHAFLYVLHDIENEAGRTRGVHWGPRTLDLDLILCGDRIVDSADLVVPHPAAWYRRFVLDPLVEIAGDASHPMKSLSIHALRERLLDRPLIAAIAGSSPGKRQECIATLQREFNDVRFQQWTPGAPEPALLFWLGNCAAGPSLEELPVVPRLDVSESADVISSMRFAVQSAVDSPMPLD